MTSTMTPEIEDYYDRVLATLDDLAPDILNDLLEDLPDHLAEVAAEGEGTLIERLGEPEAYADELRSAAGLEPVRTANEPGVGLAERLQQVAELAARLDVRVGGLVGYPRLRDLVRAAQPGWWVLRGWLVAQLIVHNTRTYSLRAALVPRVSGSLLLGFVLVLGGIIVSVWFGRRSLSFGLWPRRIIGAIGLLLVLWSATVLAGRVDISGYVDSGSYVDNSTPADDAQDIYVYDQSGHLVPGARIYDQSGNAINLGSGICSDGNLSHSADGTQYSYPLCPSDPGPFRAGPGVVPGASATPSVTPAPSAELTPSAKPTPTARPTPTGKAHPTPTTTR